MVGQTLVSYSFPYAPLAFLYTGGNMTAVGTLPGGSLAWATGINAGGQTVGVAETE